MKNLALMPHVTYRDISFGFMDVLDHYGMQLISSIGYGDIDNKYKVFVNGNWVGVVKDGATIARVMREMKVSFSANPEMAVILDRMRMELRINTDPGRCIRPLFVVRDNKLMLTKRDFDRLDPNYDSFTLLLATGKVEYIDVEEEETLLLAMYPSDLEHAQKDENTVTMYTHCEIHPSTILGIAAGTIPFPEHNPAPRNTFQCAMGKQAMGTYVNNYIVRFDTIGHLLYYSQRPLVTTKCMDMMKLDENNSGINTIVAIASSAWNQEDAIIQSQSLIDFGGFRSLYIRTYRDEEKKLGAHHQDQFEKPDRETCYGMRQGSYDKLDDDGIVGVGTTIGTDDILIGKTTPLNTQSDDDNDNDVNKQNKFTKKDHSLSNRSTESGVVDNVLITTNGEGNRCAKVKVRSVRIPQIGDKVSVRSIVWKVISIGSFVTVFVETWTKGCRVDVLAKGRSDMDSRWHNTRRHYEPTCHP